MNSLKLFLDSSYLIYLKYSKNDKVFSYVTDFLEKAVEHGDRLFINMIIIDEVVWILMKKYKILLNEILELIDRLIPLLEIIPIDYADYDVMKKVMMKYKLKPSDAIHIASMSKVKIKYIVSEDKEFDNIPWIKRVWMDVRSK